MKRSIPLAGLLLAVGFLAMHARGPAVPPPIPAGACVPWMADALTGVGGRTRDRVAEQVRQGEWERLPRTARGEVAAWFTPPPR